MKRSEINQAYRCARAFFEKHHWILPPNPQWDITDFGLGDFKTAGLAIVNLAEEPEYCEKIMYARRKQTTPTHSHRLKKEDIICRVGELALQLWETNPDTAENRSFTIQVNREPQSFRSGDTLKLQAGERVTLAPGVYHAFWPESAECIISEVSTANNDADDNVFADPNIGRFPTIEEDEIPVIRLVGEPVS